MSERWQRAPDARIMDLGERVLILGRDGMAREFDGDSASLARVVLDRLQSPVSLDEIIAHVTALAGDGATPGPVVDALLDVFRKAGVLRVVNQSNVEIPRSMPHGRRVLLCISGAVAAVDSPSLIRVLQSRGHDVRVALTRTARRFVSPEALEALTHQTVHRGIWHRSANSPVPHIELATWADVVLVAPASATTLSRIAHADCSDLVPAIVIATRAPVLVAPSMNPAMYDSAPVRRVMDLLREHGMAIAHPTMGVELAHRPGERTPVYGPSASPGTLADLLDVLLQRAGLPARHDWEAIHAGNSPEQLPWFTAELDADMAAELDALAQSRPGARVLDVGTSVGTVAIAAARRGLSVVATDASRAAVAMAARRAGELPVTWLVDDVRKSAVFGPFDAVFDRGCLHALDASEARDYMATVTRVTRPGARWVVKVHHPSEPRDLGTRQLSVDDLCTLAGGSFAMVSARESTMPGDPPRRSLLVVFERRG